MDKKQKVFSLPDDVEVNQQLSGNTVSSEIKNSSSGYSRNRDGRIDNLKCLAIFSVIWAHTGLPQTVMHCRTYDVVLLFLLSGMSLFLSRHRSSSAGSEKICAEKEKQSPVFYMLWVRIKKLLFPAYAVTTVCYFTIAASAFLLHQEQPYPFKDYVLAILFTNRGLWFIWIVKIFLLAALLSPWLCSISAKIRKDGIFLALLIGGLLLQQLLCMGTAFLAENGMAYFLKVILEDYIAGCFGYLVVYAAGIRLIQSKSFYQYLLPASLILFLIMQLQYQSFCPNSAKYPPNLYYLSYGLTVSSFLWIIVPRQSLRFTEWVGKRSYDIYIYHIPFYYLTLSIKNWQIRYALILLGAFFLTWALPVIIEKIKYFFHNYLQTVFCRNE